MAYATLDPSLDQKIQHLVEATPDVQNYQTELNRTPSSKQMVRLVDALPHNINDYVSLPVLQYEPRPKIAAVALFPKAGSNVKEWPSNRFEALVQLLCREKEIDKVNVYFSSQTECY